MDRTPPSKQVGAAQQAGRLRPELVLRVLVSCLIPDLVRLAVTKVRYLDHVVVQLLARSLAADGNQRDRVLVVGEHIMQLEAERAARNLEDPGEKLQHLVYALVVPGEEATVGNVVADVLGEELIPQCVHVAASEGRVCLPHQVFVRMCHLISPSSRWIGRGECSKACMFMPGPSPAVRLPGP